ncbi:sugar ABC transporter substrate-binding protein [Amaricoccus sp.]|uniref:ABC transporter substrate-binding protein n=1 Tax=Amaricoccus sp. TaxID=1872485 RepID=UPI001B4E09C5|nr:sugar ABC transporter substrate-binding protein [Amaricoccus sp.]MBP7242014.1 sugar ABC transporter substrate-binding protein [Amaricoccus sp.]
MTTLARISAGLLMTTCLAGAAAAQTELTFWQHGAGNAWEGKIFGQMVEEFNASQSDWKVTFQQFPQAAYNDSVTAAALSGELPDILDVDGPVMPNWAWAGYLAPLEITREELAGFLPGTIGVWKDQVYSVGLWDAAVAMITRKSILDKYGIRVPTLEQPWTGEEFNAALATIKESGDFAYPLDLGMWDKGEWYPYAYSPFLQSFGGDIVDRSTYQTAEGVLNGDAAVEFGEWWQGLFADGLAPGGSQPPADGPEALGFREGKYAITWVGNWNAAAVLKDFGDDALFLPAPDFGNGPKIGAGSWQLAVSAQSDNKEGANAFIRFALQDKYQAMFSDASGLAPATASAAAMTENYKEGAPMAVFYDLSAEQALVRPVTPGYVVEARVFRKALADIADGADVVTALDAAVDEINADIQNNQGYGH